MTFGTKLVASALFRLDALFANSFMMAVKSSTCKDLKVNRRTNWKLMSDSTRSCGCGRRLGFLYFLRGRTYHCSCGLPDLQSRLSDKLKIEMRHCSLA